MAARTSAGTGAETGAETPKERDARTVKELIEPMLVVKDNPDVWDDREVTVYNEDRQYLMNIAIGYCDCLDNDYRRADCKSLRRAKFALNVEGYDVLAWVNRDAINELLCKRLDGWEGLA